MRSRNINRTVSVLQYCVLLQWYEPFLQVGRLDQTLILLGLALCLLSAYVSSVFMTLYIFNFFVTLEFTIRFCELIVVGLAFDLVD